MMTWRKRLGVYAEIRSFLATGLTQEAIFHVWCVCSRHPGCDGPAFVRRGFHGELTFTPQNLESRTLELAVF